MVNNQVVPARFLGEQFQDGVFFFGRTTNTSQNSAGCYLVRGGNIAVDRDLGRWNHAVFIRCSEKKASKESAQVYKTVLVSDCYVLS